MYVQIWIVKIIFHTVYAEVNLYAGQLLLWFVSMTLTQPDMCCSYLQLLRTPSLFLLVCLSLSLSDTFDLSLESGRSTSRGLELGHQSLSTNGPPSWVQVLTSPHQRPATRLPSAQTHTDTRTPAYQRPAHTHRQREHTHTGQRAA